MMRVVLSPTSTSSIGSRCRAVPRRPNFKHPEVQAEILQYAEHSVLHADYEGHFGWVGLHGAFAFCFAQAEQWDLADEQFARLDGCMGDHPWDYVTAAEPTYKEWRWRAESYMAGFKPL